MSNVIFYSDKGAQQISHDFAALRTWIGANQNLKDESRRYLLLLDSIRRCEGVARLLQAKPGEMVDVRPSKNRVVPINVPGIIVGKLITKQLADKCYNYITNINNMFKYFIHLFVSLF